MTVNELAESIKCNAKTKQPMIIAIDGFGGSGKTTIATKLKELLKDVYVISLDDFILKDKLLNFSPDKIGFDRSRLEQQVLIPASKGQPIALQKLDWAENKLGEPIDVPPSKYLIIEGISSCHPDIAKYYDHKIWVDTPIEVAKQRGKLKDAGNENEQHWDVWAKNDLAYQQKYHPERHADFVIDNRKDAS